MRRILYTLFAAAILAPGVAAAGPGYKVANTNNEGPGSLRYGLEVASKIIIPGRIGDIEINGTLEYAKEAPLTIIGSGQTVYTMNNETLLAVTNGADLNIRNLHFEGPGGFSISHRGDLDGEIAGKGIFVDVRDDQAGTVYVSLKNVSVVGVANHGIHVSDCDLADDCGGGGGGAGGGSDASIVVNCVDCRVDDAGNGKFDADGLRVDERGEGGIHATLVRSAFNNVGADGVEFDEGDVGDLNIFVVGTDFSDNGGYCDPDLLAAFIPDPDEVEFELGDEVIEDQIPTDEPGSLDDSCIEREVDFFEGTHFVEKYEFGIDLDDGIDGDEAGPGTLWLAMINSTINNNLDEGVDMDEEDDGNLLAGYVSSHANFNNDDGFKMTEEDGGSTVISVRASSASYNGGVGFVFEEEDDGNLRARVQGSSTIGNDGGDLGIEAVQEPAGSGVLRIRGSSIVEGVETEGVELR